MNINKESFQANPVKLDVSRSKLDTLSHRHTTSFLAGQLIPLWAYEDVLPGDTFKVSHQAVVRSTTPVQAAMDDAYLDMYYFFVPHKLVLSRQSMSPSVLDPAHSWDAFIGAQDSKLNMPLPGDVRLPVVKLHMIDAGDAGVAEYGFSDSYLASLANYIGDPEPKIDSDGYSVDYYTSALPYLAYYQVWNDYFRDPNTQNPITFSISTIGIENVVSFSELPDRSSGVTVYVNPLDPTDPSVRYQFHNDLLHPGSVMGVCPFHGYFGSALPWPQRNSTMVEFGLAGNAPVLGLTTTTGGVTTPSWHAAGDMRLGLASGGAYVGANGSLSTAGGGRVGLGSGSITDGDVTLPNLNQGYVAANNLYADLSKAQAVSVNAFRLAIQTQRWYEALARGGNRIDEMTASMFGVTPKDAGSGKAMFLGARRVRINSTQAVNTAGSLGATGAYSLTNDMRDESVFHNSFDTWGTLMCVACVRPEEGFSQGLYRRRTRRNRLDFYWPQYANLGEQGTTKGELYHTGTSSDDEIFGYQEAWAEYRFEPNQISGRLRAGKDLAYWNYANNFASAPTLNGFLDYMYRAMVNIDKNLATSGDTAGYQFIGDFFFNVEAIRPMPTYSIPGLVDHH